MNQMYFCFVILCGIFSQGIVTCSDEKFEKKSDFHVRQKRVINNSLYANQPVGIAQVPYLVNVQKNGRNECGGIILTSEIILSVANCFRDANAFYTVLTASLLLGGRVSHNITEKLIFPHYNINYLEYDLALLFIHPVIDLVQTPNRRIELYNGTLKATVPATLSGWSKNPVKRKMLAVPSIIRSITVPIISLNECQYYYFNVRRITNKVICTLDRSGKKYGSDSDFGGPLVIAHKLAGIYFWRGNKPPSENPDVFMNLLNPFYKNWIVRNVQLYHGWF